MEILRKTGLALPAKVPWGTHLCQYYRGKGGLLELAVPYFREGLAAHESCVWIVDDLISVDEARQALQAAIPKCDSYLASGQLLVAPHDEWYLPGGSFNSEMLLARWRRTVENALAQGYCGLRASGVIASLLDGHWNELLAYEKAIQAQLQSHRLLALRSYPLERCTAAQFLQIVDSHDYVLIERQDTWECIECQTGRRLEQGPLEPQTRPTCALRDSESAWDATEHKESMKRLMVKKHALASCITPLVTTDLEGRITYANPAAMKAWKFTSKSDVLHHRASEFWEQPSLMNNCLERIQECGQFVEELVARRKDGSTFDVVIFGSLTLDDHGQPIGIVASMLDVTVRKTVERCLRESQTRYRTLVENIDLGIGLIDRQHTILTANRGLARIAGQTTCDAMVGRKCFEVNEGRHAPCPHCPGKRALATGKQAETEVAFTRVDGSKILVRIRAYPVYDSQGSLSGFIEVVEDITERKQAEKQLAHFSAIVSSSMDAIIGTTLEGIITSWNPGAERLYEYTAQEMIGQSLLKILPPDRPNKPADLFSLSLKGDARVRHYDTVRRRKDGALVDVSITLSPIRDDNGRIIGASTIAHEITDRKRAEQDLINAKQAAEAANRAKSEFLANMSHEIRTPMTAILGFADILLSQPPAPEATEAAQIIKRNGEQLLDIINDILDLSKIEAGKFDVQHQPCSPRKLIDDVLATMRVRADAKGLQLDAEFDVDVPETIVTDPIRLRQILVNLVGNAVKFTEIGSVNVAVRLDPIHKNEHLLRFDVVDTGIGMSAAQVDVLFQPFSQADGSTTRRFGGTGLGLAISKRLATMLGGDIYVSSIPDKGSTFSVTIAADPLSGRSSSLDGEESHEALSHAADQKPLNCRVLLAEDGPDNQRLITFLLRKAGCEVFVAEHGQKAIEAVLAAEQSNAPFDAVLMDIQMPVMDGCDATRRLRENGFVKPIIALTAHAMTDDRQRCLDAGCDDYASKPIQPQQLIQSLATWLAKSRQQVK
jgi:PAS domain S-box-containing protein